MFKGLNFNKALLFFNVFFLESYLVRFSLGSYPTNLQEVLITIQAVTFVFFLVRNKLFLRTLKNIHKHWVFLSFVILTVISLVTVPIVNKPDFLHHGKFLFFALVLCFIFLETFQSNKERLEAVKVMGLGAIAFGVFSLIYNLLGFNVAYDYRLLGPLDAAVYLGYYLTPFFLFFFLQFLQQPKKKGNLMFAIILGLLILATRSMACIGASFVIVVVYFLKRTDREIFQKTWVKIIFAFATLLIVGTTFYTKILPFLTESSSSLGEREQIWTTSLDLLHRPQVFLFGLGLGQFQDYFASNVDRVLGHPPLDYSVLQPHNLFLLFLFQYGLLGLLFILFCIYKNLKNLLSLSKKDQFDALSQLILLYFFLHGLIDTPLFKNDLLFLFILFLEMALIPFKKLPMETISGVVVKGEGKGREINFPTINVPYPHGKLTFGVYACQVYTPVGFYKGALHYGPRRILGLMEPALEVHLLDFEGDLYGKEVKIEVFQKVRDTKDYVDFETLKKQIVLDVQAVRNISLPQ